MMSTRWLCAVAHKGIDGDQSLVWQLPPDALLQCSMDRKYLSRQDI